MRRPRNQRAYVRTFAFYEEDFEGRPGRNLLLEDLWAPGPRRKRATVSRRWIPDRKRRDQERRLRRLNREPRWVAHDEEDPCLLFDPLDPSAAPWSPTESEP